MPKKSETHCEFCGHFVTILQKAHIIAEGPKKVNNLLMLCPTCHLMFDIHVKPKIFKALKLAGVKNIPKSWEKSIYQQAAAASKRVLSEK